MGEKKEKKKEKTKESKISGIGREDDGKRIKSKRKSAHSQFGASGRSPPLPACRTIPIRQAGSACKRSSALAPPAGWSASPVLRALITAQYRIVQKETTDKLGGPHRFGLPTVCLAPHSLGLPPSCARETRWALRQGRHMLDGQGHGDVDSLAQQHASTGPKKAPGRRPRPSGEWF